MPAACQSDVIFVVDASVSSSNFARMKSFLSQLVARFDINRRNTRVGLLTYASSVRTRFYLSSYTSLASVQRAIARLSYSAGSSNTAAALSFVRRYMLSSTRGDRSNVPNVVVVLTDARSTSTSATKVCTMLTLLLL